MNSIQELRAAIPRAPAPAEPPKPTGKARFGAVGILVLVAAVGISVGIALDRFVLPHRQAPPPAEAAAAVPVAAAPATALVASGAFIQPDRNNPLRHGSGGVSVFADKVVFGDDFAVTPGPDYRVLLVPKPALRSDADIAHTMYVDLGPLGAFKGSQTFVVPAGVNVADYPSVAIWCRTYAALISTADLSFAKAGS